MAKKSSSKLSKAFPKNNIIILGRGGDAANLLSPSPFQKLEKLLVDIKPKLTSGQKILPLHLGEPDGGMPLLAKPILAQQKFYDGFGKYPELLGSNECRMAIKNWAIRRFSLRANLLATESSVNNILPTSGSREGLAMAIGYAVKKKQIKLKHQIPLVVITNPFYHVYQASGVMAGAEVMAIHCFDEMQLDKNHIAKKLSLADGILSLPLATQKRIAAIVVCTPDNPTGRILTMTEMEHLYDIARQCDSFVISDECYSDLYDGVPSISFLNHADNGFGLGRMIISNSLSKRSGVPGLRAGVLIGDRAVIKEMAILRAHLSAIHPQSLQMIATDLWNDDAHVVVNRQKYNRRAKTAATVIGRSPSFQMPSAGFFLYLRFDKNVGGAAMVRDIYAATGIKLLPAIFMAGQTADDTKNPAYAYARLSMIIDGDEWLSVLQQLKPFLLLE
ncbi:MAG: aminotransferase class I/II-fold pyridoxal phosphate-dependent enzyme [Alphaproteobacteria bacterium]